MVIKKVRADTRKVIKAKVGYIMNKTILYSKTKSRKDFMQVLRTEGNMKQTSKVRQCFSGFPVDCPDIVM